jgi:UrcA family protein
MKMVHSTTHWTDVASDFLLTATRIAAFLILLALGAHLARAGETGEPPRATNRSAVVSVADLDLSTEAGRQVARQRLHNTARLLCRGVTDPWSLSHHDDYVACVDGAMASALARLPSPALAANSTAH